MANGKIEKTYDYGPRAGGAPRQIIVMLHGVGSNGQDLISLAPHFADELSNAVFISPDAPFVCDMVPPGYPNSYQWFSLQSRAPEDMLRGVEETAPILEDFLDGLLEKYKLGADKLALVGFSQGTMTSLYAGPRYPQKIAGILGYSGALIGGEGFIQDPDEYHKPPVCLIHGEADEVVPLVAYKMAREQLEEAGFEVTGHTTPGLTHGIDEKGIRAGTEFLVSIFDGESV